MYFRSAIVLGSLSNLRNQKWILSDQISHSALISIGRRSICINTILQKKQRTEPEAQVLVNKTNQRSTNKKTLFERKIKQKATVWGVIDVYRFITIEKLASLMNKSDGNYC